jgi:hypothetical protein
MGLALTKAEAYNTILVEGTFLIEGTLLIRKPMAIIGNGKAVFDRQDKSAIFYIMAD